MAKKRKRKISHKSNKKRGKKHHVKSSKISIKDILLAVLVSCILFISLFVLIFPIRTAKGISMKPTIRNNEKIVVSRTSNEINRFDVVSIKKGSQHEFKRIIGLPGERIRYSTDTLYVNEEVVEEKFLATYLNDYRQCGEIFTQSSNGDNDFQSGVIPKDYYLVLGDNRPNASDSRQFGFISKESVKGKAIFSLTTFKKIL